MSVIKKDLTIEDIKNIVAQSSVSLPIGTILPFAGL